MYEIEFAKDLINKKNFNEAIIFLKKAIKKNNKESAAFFELGKVFFIKNNFKKAIVNFRKSISIKDSFYSNLLLAKSLINIGSYREGLRILFRLKKSSFKILEDIDVEIVNCFLSLRKYLYAYKYFDKYSIENFLLHKRIIYNLLNRYMLNNKKLPKEINTFVYKFLSNNNNNKDDKIVIEMQMLQLYKKNNLVQKEKFYKYILARNKEKTKNICKLKHYNFILNKLEINRKDINLCSKPISLVITLTNRCNIKCIFCNISKLKSWNLQNEKIKDIMNLIPYLKIINWLGGEIFLYNGFLSLFDFAAKNNVFQEIITNGLLLNKDLIFKFIKTPMKLSISITSVNKENYEFLHKGASFEKLIYNLNIIKNNIDKKNNDFGYWMYVCVMKENILELEDIIEFAYKYKFDTVRFQPLEQLSFKFYNKNIVKYFVKKAILKAEKYGIKINNILPIDFSNYQEPNLSKTKEELEGLFVKGNNDFNNKTELLKQETCNKNVLLIDKTTLFCEHPWTTMILNYEGRITFNCFCEFNKLETINDKNLLSAWNSQKIQSFRNKIKKRQVHNICNYNCIAYNVHRN